MVAEGSHNRMRMIRHNAPGEELVPVLAKVQERSTDNVRDPRIVHEGSPVSGIKVILDLLGVKKSESFQLVLCKRALHLIGAGDDVLTLKLPRSEDLGGQTVRESEDHGVRRALAGPVGEKCALANVQGGWRAR